MCMHNCIHTKKSKKIGKNKYTSKIRVKIIFKSRREDRILWFFKKETREKLYGTGHL